LIYSAASRASLRFFDRLLFKPPLLLLLVLLLLLLLLLGADAAAAAAVIGTRNIAENGSTMNERRTAAEDAHKPPKITRQSPPPALYVHKARRLPISLCLSFTFPLALHLSPSLNQSIACRRRLIISEGGNYNNNRRVYSHLSLVFFLFHLPPNNARLSLSLSLSLSLAHSIRL
jgi:hypothetical protein